MKDCSLVLLPTMNQNELLSWRWLKNLFDSLGSAKIIIASSSIDVLSGVVA